MLKVFTKSQQLLLTTWWLFLQLGPKKLPILFIPSAFNLGLQLPAQGEGAPMKLLHLLHPVSLSR